MKSYKLLQRFNFYSVTGRYAMSLVQVCFVALVMSKETDIAKAEFFVILSLANYLPMFDLAFQIKLMKSNINDEKYLGYVFVLILLAIFVSLVFMFTYHNSYILLSPFLLFIYMLAKFNYARFGPETYIQNIVFGIPILITMLGTIVLFCREDIQYLSATLILFYPFLANAYPKTFLKIKRASFSASIVELKQHLSFLLLAVFAISTAWSNSILLVATDNITEVASYEIILKSIAITFLPQIVLSHRLKEIVSTNENSFDTKKFLLLGLKLYLIGICASLILALSYTKMAGVSFDAVIFGIVALTYLGFMLIIPFNLILQARLETKSLIFSFGAPSCFTLVFKIIFFHALNVFYLASLTLASTVATLLILLVIFNKKSLK